MACQIGGQGRRAGPGAPAKRVGAVYLAAPRHNVGTGSPAQPLSRMGTPAHRKLATGRVAVLARTTIRELEVGAFLVSHCGGSVRHPQMRRSSN